MRNEYRHFLMIMLACRVSGALAEPAASGPGVWFETNPCPAEAEPIAPVAGSPVLLDVHYTPEEPARSAVLVYAADGLWRAPYESWASWTPMPPSRTETDPSGTRWAVLKPDAGLALRFDACRSALWIDANPWRLQQASVDQPASHSVSTAGHGGYLNLDGQYGGLAGRNALNAVVDVGAFLPGGAGRSSVFASRRVFRRLESHWLSDDPENALRLRLGDSITHSADWESAVRFGGVQWGTDFALQPDRITFPLPSIAGSAALASTAQLYVNGIRQSQQPLQPGSFRFDSVPTLTGAGELSVTLRDALGREQTISQPFYASPRLLRDGLEDRTVEAGLLRVNYAGYHDRYTTAFAASTWRRGLSDTTTVLTRLSASQARQQLGAEADWILLPFGVFTLSGAATRAERGVGAIATLAFERIAENMSFSLRRRIASRDYADLGRDPGSLHFSDAARVSFRLSGIGTASAIYVSEQPWSGLGTRLAGLAWSLPVSARAQIYASWLHAIGGDAGDSIVLGLSATLGRGRSGGLQYSNDDGRSGARAYFQQSPDGPLGLFLHGSADSRDTGLREAGAAWATTRGAVGLGYAGIGDRGSASAFMQTSLAMVDGHGYWSRPIQNSFAVVDTGGIGGVRVLRENQLIGRTGDDGRLLLPDLLPYQRNRIAIDDRDLPIALGIVNGSAVVAPPAEAGVPIRFVVDARPLQRLRLLDEHGAPVPAGAALTLDGVALPLPVGYDGLVYLELAADRGGGPHRLEARWNSGACELQFRSANEPMKCRPKIQ